VCTYFIRSMMLKHRNGNRNCIGHQVKPRSFSLHWILRQIHCKLLIIKWTYYQSVLNDAQGFWHAVTGLESDDNLTAQQKWLINMKARYLYCALAHAKMMMPLCQNWDNKCCQKASDHLLLCE
jgi:hypothetical protein